MNMLDKITNYYLLISRMDFKQFYYRALKIIKFKFIYPKWWEKLFPFNIKATVYEINAYYFFKWKDFKMIQNDLVYNNNVIEMATNICNYKFTFLNITQKFKDCSIN